MLNHKNSKLFSGQWIDVMHEEGYEYIARKRGTGTAVIIALTKNNELLLTEQYRVPIGADVLELPAGIVGDEPGRQYETAHEAALRELLEETGYEAPFLEEMAIGPVSSGISNEMMTFFYTDAARKRRKGGSESEHVTIHTVPLADIESYLEYSRGKGLIIDPKIYTGLYFAEKYQHAMDEARPIKPELVSAGH